MTKLRSFIQNRENRPFLLLFFVLLAIKIMAAALFSSDYQDQLFIPFISRFLKSLQNPWDLFLTDTQYRNLPSPFPYPPVMLCLYTVPVYFAEKIASHSGFLQNLIFKLPTLLMDILSCYVLLRMHRGRKIAVLLIYFASPVVLYACYMHSQLDLAPTTLLLCSLFLLQRNNLLVSSVALGLAIAAKFHVAAALPMIFIYVLKNYKTRYAFYYIMITATVSISLTMPFAGSPGFQYFVMNNEQQRKIYDAFYQIGSLKVFLPIFAVLILYARFFLYRKINTDLLLSFLTILFLVFIMLISPAPGWFVWIVPFMAIFLLKQESLDQRMVFLHAGLSIACVFYSIFFYTPEIQDLKFLGIPVSIKLQSPMVRNLGFTAMEALFFCTLVFLYRYGVRSNLIYRMDQAIIIGIAGDSSAGKSTLLADIKSVISNERLVLLEGDGDHRWERGDEQWQSITHLSPKANFLHRQAEQILALKNRNSIHRHNYDHSTGKFTHPEKILSNDVVILSGLHAFYLPISRRAIDLKIYIEVEERLRRHWKILRDTAQRGHSAAAVITQIEARMVDARKYIYPQKRFADMVVEYFTDDVFEAGDVKADYKLQFRVSLNANINIELVLSIMERLGIEYMHDYDEDLRMQWVRFEKPFDLSHVCTEAPQMIGNLEEIMGKNIVWQNDYRGFVQLIVAFSLSHLVRGRNDLQGHIA